MKHALKSNFFRNIELSNIFYILNVKEFVNFEDQRAFCENKICLVKHMLNFEHPLFKQKFKSEAFNDLI